MLFRPGQADRAAACGPGGASASVVSRYALLEIVGDAYVVGAVAALEDVAVEHRGRKGEEGHEVPLTFVRDTISWSDMVEAGGVEPPSEKPCHQKTTCLARSGRLPPMAVCAFAGERSVRARNASD